MDLWIKRDDLTGFAFGGNKGRKLEFILADALAHGADTVVSCGATQSNFIRQLGAAASVAGIECHAVLMDEPYEPGLRATVVGGLNTDGEHGNLLLDRLLGVRVSIVPNGPWETLFAETNLLADRLEADGRRVVRVPIGGSSPLGALAFVDAASELARERFDVVIVATSSGSTHAGLHVGFSGTGARVIGISCDPEPEVAEEVGCLARAAASELGIEPPNEEPDVRFDFVGPAYGVPSEEGQRALVRLARSEGIFLDPVYTAKAFAGLLALAERGGIAGRVLFWHTGGLPALFGYLPAIYHGTTS